MMHQMNRSATARKFEDPGGFRTPVSASLPRRGTDAGRWGGQSAVSSHSALGYQPYARYAASCRHLPPVGRRLNFAVLR
jgi:hypothetical protein